MDGAGRDLAAEHRWAALELVPVIALGAPVASAARADERMRLVRDALTARGVALPGLELWVVDGERVERKALGSLGGRVSRDEHDLRAQPAEADGA